MATWPYDPWAVPGATRWIAPGLSVVTGADGTRTQYGPQNASFPGLGSRVQQNTSVDYAEGYQPHPRNGTLSNIFVESGFIPGQSTGARSGVHTVPGSIGIGGYYGPDNPKIPLGGGTGNFPPQYVGAIGPNSGLGMVPGLNQLNIDAQQAANLARIPGAAGLESQSSADIAALLNPPQMFPEVDRRTAEVTGGRGIAGSTAAGGTGVRMTDDERLRRMALGQQFLSAAYGRNPAAPIVDPTKFVITPYQQAELDLQRFIASLGLLHRGGAGGGGSPFGGGGGGGRSPAVSSSRDLSGLLTPPTSGRPGTGMFGWDEPAFESEPPLGTYYDPLSDSSVFDPMAEFGYGGEFGYGQLPEPELSEFYDPNWDFGE